MSILRRYAKPVGLGLVVAGVMFGVYLFTITAPRMRSFGFDAFAYWNVTLPDPYTIQYGAIGSYNYSPPFAQVADFFSAFQWNDFVFVWTMLLIGSVIWIAGSPGWILAAFATPFVAIELYHGNVHILMAVAILLGFKHPWTWAFVLLTKPSSGVGLLWFVVRGEWRPLFIAIGTAGAISAVSFVFDPQLWFGWVDVILDNLGRQPLSNHFGIPLWIRLPAAVVLVIWGARTDRRWTVVVSSMLALPVLWFAAPAMLIGVIPDIRARNEARKRETAAAIEAETAGAMSG